MSLTAWINDDAIVVNESGAVVLCDTCPCEDTVVACDLVLPPSLTVVYQLVYRPVDCDDGVTPVGPDVTVDWTTTATFVDATPGVARWRIQGTPHTMFSYPPCDVDHPFAFGDPNPQGIYVSLFCLGGIDPPNWHIRNLDGDSLSDNVDAGGGDCSGGTIDPLKVGNPFDKYSVNPLLVQGCFNIAWRCLFATPNACWTGTRTVTISGAAV